ncbi:MAG TPA: acyl-CoA dehydrogenase [Polyangiaceae bacterium]|nr:acyl-CoA dehydrogenase [Polyangiaceae bacterium]
MLRSRWGAARCAPRTPERSPAPAQYELRLAAIEARDVRRWLYRSSAEQLSFRDQVKALLSGPEFAPRPAASFQEQAQRCYARFQLLRERLELRIRDVQERPARLSTALELAAAVDAALFSVLSSHYCLCGGTLLRYAETCPAIEGYLRELDSGETLGAFAVTELAGGSDAASLQTRADYDPAQGDLVLSTPSAEARKFMVNAACAGVPKLGIVMARLYVQGVERGVFPLVVRLRTRFGVCPGVGISALGSAGSAGPDPALLGFDGVRVPLHGLLLAEDAALLADGTFWSSVSSGRERFARSIERVQLGRLCLSAAAATLTGASAFIAIQYGEQRRARAPRHPDPSVIEYRNHQRDVFCALAQAYASRCLVDLALAKHQATPASERAYLFRICAVAKAQVTRAAERAARRCRERCGGAALFEENRLSEFAACAQAWLTAAGDNQVLLLKVARQMLLRRGYVRLPRWSADPAAPLADAARLIGLLRERERRLLDELRGALAQPLVQGARFTSWNENVNLALETASAHASRLAAEAFAARLAELDDAHPAQALFRLFALQELGPQLGFYLAEELISRAELKAHGSYLDAACRELRPFAVQLASAFDVPNSVLRAPLAGDDYVAHYEHQARQGELAAEAPVRPASGSLRDR